VVPPKLQESDAAPAVLAPALDANDWYQRETGKLRPRTDRRGNRLLFEDEPQ